MATDKSTTSIASGNNDGSGLAFTLLSQAVRMHQQGQLEQAKNLYQAVLQIAPTSFDALHLLGVAYCDLGNAQAAAEKLSRALSIRPRSVAAHQNLGIALRKLKRQAEAASVYERGLAIEPDNAELLNNLGNVQLELGMPRKALESYERAIAIAPDFVDAHDNRGNALRELHCFDEALACYQRAQLLSPEFASAYWNEALCRLLLGQLPEGWAMYEWGWRAGPRGAARPFSCPLWRGEQSLNGKSILLHAEQGLGDTIQFCRYVMDVAKLGARVILEVQRPLIGLLKQLRGVEQLIARGDPLPETDFHCPLLSLPFAFRTELHSIPAPTPYLAPDSHLMEAWQQRLGPPRGLRVGISWAGNPHHAKDRQRSIPLQMLSGLKSKDIEFFCLQKDLSAEEAASAPLVIHHEGRNFTDTAALTSLMDLVISVDTSIAHLAGSLAVPAWIMLPYTPDWRWMLDRSDSPWYPTLKLFRQPAPGDWPNVIEAIRKALAHNLGGGDGVSSTTQQVS